MKPPHFCPPYRCGNGRAPKLHHFPRAERSGSDGEFKGQNGGFHAKDPDTEQERHVERLQAGSPTARAVSQFALARRCLTVVPVGHGLNWNATRTAHPSAEKLVTAQQFRQLPYDLTVSAIDIHTDLCDEGVGGSDLRYRVTRYGKLSEAEYANSKLGNIHDTNSELTNCNDTFRYNRNAVGTVFESDVNER